MKINTKFQLKWHQHAKGKQCTRRRENVYCCRRTSHHFKQKKRERVRIKRNIPVCCRITHRATRVTQPNERTKDNFRIIVANEAQNRLTLFAWFRFCRLGHILSEVYLLGMKFLVHGTRAFLAGCETFIIHKIAPTQRKMWHYEALKHGRAHTERVWRW